MNIQMIQHGRLWEKLAENKEENTKEEQPIVQTNKYFSLFDRNSRKSNAFENIASNLCPLSTRPSNNFLINLSLPNSPMRK